MLEPAVLIIGGGIAGIQAALDVAEQGVLAYLVEKSPSIGGHMAMLDKTFPTLDCSLCILTPKMVDVARHPNVRLLTYSEVVGAERAGKIFRVRVLKKARYVDEGKCTGCGVCTEKCPIEVPDEFNMGLGPRRAIYIPFPQAVPKVALIDYERCIRCGLCRLLCEAGAIDFDQKDEELTLEVGAIIVATGFRQADVSALGEYGYGRYDNVITALELERLLNAAGPTGGEVLRPSDGKAPGKVAFIQRGGSRDRRLGRPYCSRVCCMYAVKNAVLIKEHHPEAEVTIYYI
ncbi:disulfide reductase, partial [Candidatus Bathyarchaeota archaeon]